MILAQIGNGTFEAFAAFVISGTCSAGDRAVLALVTAPRQPGIAIAIGGLVYPAEKAVPAAVMLYLLISIAISVPYVMWRKHAFDAAPAKAP
jgi:hypothetical protein